jgi:serine/threonine-protein kinase
MDELDEEAPPERIGAYRIVERIGRGGMGSVYRAERTTGDFQHIVAIKIIKPGLLSESLVERFQRERQILARLVHPHVAQLYDGGETEGGSPFIIMEHVDGLPLLQWTEANDADRAERLRLFRDICGAVAFANRNLIVHRDLTPSNVLVTGDGVVKLIDFGISKPVDAPGRAGDKVSIGSLSLTPGFAAPERLVSAQVSTAADIYSLGRLLEKLLPPDPRDGDYAAVLAKATAAEPGARYASADALWADVDAWDRGLPVSARPQTRSYVAARFVARHRLGVGIAAAVLLLLLGALGVTLSAYGRAERARAAEAARFAELRSLAGYMIFDLNGQLARVAGNTRARATLSDRAQRYLSALAASTASDDALQREAARGFIALAFAQGVPGQPNLGERDQASANLDKAIAMLKASPADAAATAPDLAVALSGRAMMAGNVTNRIDLAQADMADAARRLNAVPAAARADRWFTARRLLTRTQAEIATLENDAPAVRRLALQLRQESRAGPEARRRTAAALLDYAYSFYYVGIAGYLDDHLTEGLAANRQAETLFAALDRDRPDDPVILYARAWNAQVGYSNASGIPAEMAQGEAYVALADGLLRRLVTMEANDTALKAFAANVGQSRAQLSADEGDFPGAIARQQAVIALFEQSLRLEAKSTTRNRLTLSEVTLGKIARRAGERDLMCRSYRSAAARMAQLEREKLLLGLVASHKPDIADALRRCGAG